MLLNLKSKIKYVYEVVKKYQNWYVIFFDRLFSVRVKKIKLREGTVIIGGEDSLILDLVDEIFIKKVYNPKFLSINSNDIVMDLGANIGVFSLYAAKMGANKIYSVEPLQKNVKLIKKNFEINKLKKPTTIKMAVSDKIAVKKFYLGDIDSHGLLFGHHSQNINKFLKVKTTNLSDIFKKYKIKKLDFLKIDCEGSEGEIVGQSGKKIWEKINKVAIEYHDDISTMSHEKIVEKMKENKYKIKVRATGQFLGYIYAWRV